MQINDTDAGVEPVDIENVDGIIFEKDLSYYINCEQILVQMASDQREYIKSELFKAIMVPRITRPSDKTIKILPLDFKNLMCCSGYTVPEDSTKWIITFLNQENFNVFWGLKEVPVKKKSNGDLYYLEVPCTFTYRPKSSNLNIKCLWNIRVHSSAEFPEGYTKFLNLSK